MNEEITKEKTKPRVLSVRFDEAEYADLETLRKRLGFRTKPETILALLRENLKAQGIVSAGEGIAVIKSKATESAGSTPALASPQ